MRILFVSHQQRGHAALAAGAARAMADEWHIEAAELGSHQFGQSPWEQTVWTYAIDHGLALGNYRTRRCTPDLTQLADIVAYMDDEDKLRLERFVEVVGPPKYVNLASLVGLDQVPTLLVPNEVLRREVCDLIVLAAQRLITSLRLAEAQAVRAAVIQENQNGQIINDATTVQLDQ